MNNVDNVLRCIKKTVPELINQSVYTMTFADKLILRIIYDKTTMMFNLVAQNPLEPSTFDMFEISQYFSEITVLLDNNVLSTYLKEDDLLLSKTSATVLPIVDNRFVEYDAEGNRLLPVSYDYSEAGVSHLNTFSLCKSAASFLLNHSEMFDNKDILLNKSSLEDVTKDISIMLQTVKGKQFFIHTYLGPFLEEDLPSKNVASFYIAQTIKLVEHNYELYTIAKHENHIDYNFEEQKTLYENSSNSVSINLRFQDKTKQKNKPHQKGSLTMADTKEILKNDKFEFIKNNDKKSSVTITKYIGNNSNVKIPKGIKVGDVWYNPTQIADKTFQNNQTIKSVDLNNSIITTIGDSAFADMPNLSEVNMQYALRITTIGDSAFANNKKLNSIVIPNSVKKMQSSTFDKSITIECNSSSYAKQFSKAFDFKSVNIKSLKEKSKDKMFELGQTLKAGVKDVYASGKYSDYLKTMSKFHQYSFRNSMLIFIQKPNASHCASYTTWKTKFGRQVKTGETGISIFSKPIKIKQYEKDEKGNDLLINGEKVEIFPPLNVFKVEKTFDVSQTEGRELPNLLTDLQGDISNSQDILQAIEKICYVPINYFTPQEDLTLLTGAKGYYSPSKNCIVINKEMSPIQQIKTAIHEVTHAELHAPEIVSEADKSVSVKEVEAESTAFVVCNHFGIDASDYSFGYIASWSEGKEITELEASLERIQTQAKSLISEIDEALLELQKENNIEKQVTNEIVNQPTQPMLNNNKESNTVKTQPKRNADEVLQVTEGKDATKQTKPSVSEVFAAAKSEAAAINAQQNNKNTPSKEL